MGIGINAAMVGFDLTWILSGILLIPYLVWGIYLLRQRLLYNIELDRAIETFTVVFLILFFFFELTLMRMWLAGSPIKLVFAVLGLFVSALALYGPLMISFGSHLLIDLLMPTGRHDSSVPLYGAAEGFEERGDYEGAAREYMVLARKFPKDLRASLRAADNLAKLDMFEDAAPWFETAFSLAKTDEDALPIVNRLTDIYARRLEQPDDASEVLKEFLERFPQSAYAGSVKDRLNRFRQGPRDSTPPQAQEG